MGEDTRMSMQRPAATIQLPTYIAAYKEGPRV
jgi:hypothetical protein